MTNQDDIPQLPSHVAWGYVEEYRATHSYLVILLANEDRSELTRLRFRDCEFLSGPTSEQSGRPTLTLEGDLISFRLGELEARGKLLEVETISA